MNDKAVLRLKLSWQHLPFVDQRRQIANWVAVNKANSDLSDIQLRRRIDLFRGSKYIQALPFSMKVKSDLLPLVSQDIPVFTDLGKMSTYRQRNI